VPGPHARSQVCAHWCRLNVGAWHSATLPSRLSQTTWASHRGQCAVSHAKGRKGDCPTAGTRGTTKPLRYGKLFDGEFPRTNKWRGESAVGYIGNPAIGDKGRARLLG